MYKDKKYRVRSLAEIKTDIAMAKQHYGNLEKVFLADGDALAMSCSDLLEIISDLYRNFPDLRHIGIYAGTRTILNKTDAELKALRKARLTIAYLGVETGDEQLLKEINKGVTYREIVAAGQKIVRSGIKLSVTVLLGLAGRRERSLEHALATARICNEIDPDFLAALTLMVVPGTPIARQVQRGEFQLLDQFEIIQEMKVLIENLDLSHCEFRSNHASNYLAIKGSLPQDKTRMLDLIGSVLNGQETQALRPEFLRGL
jgi:radical SAM superfamily enzyme YgiQ (UPF0313 family)